ncbi:unnamed protein product [Soboliphyme baturini]|uniref:NADH dehydrogenase [ubiquinone] 1 beta subcomplex subunit 4 n=1 Tax=Soboliphyme baturini TaxID=241478 RepID=A0A183J1I7_9BILA|nr:unnamed protein product [Soboliphyme baturini]
MKLTRLLSAKPPQPLVGMWQDPLFGYFETHGKMEFKPGEDYGLTEAQKKAVMERYRRKEILKREYLLREFDPLKYKYIEGCIVDPCMFRWYAADMQGSERFFLTPKSFFYGLGWFLLVCYLFCRWNHNDAVCFWFISQNNI